MTAKRLNEIKKKFENNTGDIKDLNEILSDLFLSNSNHFKDIKTQLSEIQHNQEALYREIESLKSSMNPIYTIIQSDDEED
jgi:predicted  nucleic acid-binding Zn-ribbon protein